MGSYASIHQRCSGQANVSLVAARTEFLRPDRPAANPSASFRINSVR